MTEQQIDIRYVKSPLWRIVSATGAAVNSFNSPPTGNELFVRFSAEWVDVERESFRADVDPNTGTMRVTSPPQVAVGQLFRVEELAVRLRTTPAVNLTVALLAQLQIAPDLSEEQKQLLRDALPPFANLAE